MTNRLPAGPALLLAVALSACATAAPRTEEALVARARGVHERVVTIDTHVDIPDDFATGVQDPLDRDAQVNLLKMREGGLDAAFFAVYVGQGDRTPAGNEQARQLALQKFAAIHRMADTLHADRIGLALRADDVERIASGGRLVAAIGIENGYVVGRDLALVERYHGLGARYMTLAHSRNNDICDSSTDPAGPEHGGLSEFGRRVVAEMNRVGMMVDVSHVSKACMMQATALSRLPVMASHSSTRSVADHPRNMDDEQLRAVRENGGVVQMVAFAGYVRVAPAGQPPAATVQDFVDHVDHAVRVAGIDHVGISSDFDGGGGITGWDDATETFNVTLELVRRGYSEEEVRKLWGGNLLRVWRENERGAGR